MLDGVAADLPSPAATSASVIKNATNSVANPILIESSSSSGASSPTLPPTLTSTYLKEADVSSRSGMRKILRAVFADASDASLSEYHEIWPGETKVPKSDEGNLTGERKKLDLDEGKFGDYWDDEELDDAMDEDDQVAIKQEEGGKQRKSGRTVRRKGEYKVRMDLNYGLERHEDNDGPSPQVAAGSNPIEQVGGMENLQLRRRALVWLSNAVLNQENGVATLRDLLDLVGEFIKPLPLPVFTFLVSPASSKQDDFPDVTLARIHTSLLHVLLPGTHVPVFQYAIPTQEVFQHWYLPLATASSSAVDIAKANLLLEALARLLWRNGMLKAGLGLGEATEKGIKARDKKLWAAIQKGKSKIEPDEAKMAAEQAHVRLRMIVAAVEKTPRE